MPGGALCDGDPLRLGMQLREHVNLEYVAAVLDGGAQRAAQVLHSLAAVRHHGHDSGVQSLGELRRVNCDATSERDVAHVERQHDGEAKLEHLARQVEVAAEVRGIHDDQHCVRALHACEAAEEHVHGNHLVRAVRRKRVRSRQVHQFDLDAAQRQPTRALFDGDPRVVGHLLADARERREQGALAGVGIADYRHHDTVWGGARTGRSGPGLAAEGLRCVHRMSFTLTSTASLRLSDNE